ncbi:hypothetical protein NECID01_0740 [Nematocida sp. AWRm77]|nr:hypothetical protein NECID01_0740 [Nematocida sp. AWRm77]
MIRGVPFETQEKMLSRKRISILAGFLLFITTGVVYFFAVLQLRAQTTNKEDCLRLTDKGDVSVHSFFYAEEGNKFREEALLRNKAKKDRRKHHEEDLLRASMEEEATSLRKAEGAAQKDLSYVKLVSAKTSKVLMRIDTAALVQCMQAQDTDKEHVPLVEHVHFFDFEDTPEKCCLHFNGKHRDLPQYLSRFLCWIKQQDRIRVKKLVFVGTILEDTTVSALMEGLSPKKLVFAGTCISTPVLRVLSKAKEGLSALAFCNDCILVSRCQSILVRERCPISDAGKTSSKSFFPRIKKLSIRSFTTSVFVEVLMCMASFESLEVLLLDSSRIETLSTLGELQVHKLSTLIIINECQIRGLEYSVLTRLANLRKLHIHNNCADYKIVYRSSAEVGAELTWLKYLESVYVDVLLYQTLKMHLVHYVSADPVCVTILYFIPRSSKSQDIMVQMPWKWVYHPAHKMVICYFLADRIKYASRQYGITLEAFPFSQSQVTALLIVFLNSEKIGSELCTISLKKISFVVKHMPVTDLLISFENALCKMEYVKKLAFSRDFQHVQRMCLQSIPMDRTEHYGEDVLYKYVCLVGETLDIQKKAVLFLLLRETSAKESVVLFDVKDSPCSITECFQHFQTIEQTASSVEIPSHATYAKALKQFYLEGGLNRKAHAATPIGKKIMQNIWKYIQSDTDFYGIQEFRYLDTIY